MLLSPV
jgi:hypothetical protein